jgi:hypothetical protein
MAGPGRPQPYQPPREVIAWRRARLREAGCRGPLAERLARDTRYDLHALLELVDRGCPAALAARIVAPLDAADTPGAPWPGPAA